jgi:CxxC motif-containing protein (DUF1111 family)
MTLKDWKLKEILQGIGLLSTFIGLPVFADEELAHGKQGWASSELQPAKLAFDGDSNSRWESAHKVAPSWLTVDLGALSKLSSIQIDWERANADSYLVEGSLDNKQWQVLSNFSGGKVGDRTDLLDISGNYRYVRIYATKHSEHNGYGFSIRELKIYGEVSEVTEPPIDTPPAETVNLARGKQVTASTALQSAAFAVDGKMSSRWESAHKVSPSWISVDLGSVRPIQQVVVHWENANAARYQLEGSADGQQWQLLTEHYQNQFGERTDKFAIETELQYLRLTATEPSSGNAWGYSIRELEIFGVKSDHDDTEPQPPENPPQPPVNLPQPPMEAPVEPPLHDKPLPEGALPLFAKGNAVKEQVQYREQDGTLVTLVGMRPTERHARERGEPWDAPDQSAGRYLTYPPFYFQNRSFGLEIRDTVPAGGKTVEVWLHVNEGSFFGTTFSLFRNILDPNVRDFGWSLNYGFNNPNEDGRPLCHAGKRECMMSFSSNWRTDPHSPLKIGDKIELAPAPRLLTPVIDGGGERYYSFEQLYIVGVGLKPWYGIVPNLDSEPLPQSSLLGGDTSLSYNYSEEPHRVFQQMANNIGISNTKHFLQGRRLFHTSFISGEHSESPDTNPVFQQHKQAIVAGYNNERCIGCHQMNGRSPVPVIGDSLNGYSVLTAQQAGEDLLPDPLYGWNIQSRHRDSSKANAVLLQNYVKEIRTLADGSIVELQKPLYQFDSGEPVLYSVRQAPQLIGLGLIEAIAEQDILANADPEDLNGDGIRGIPNWVVDPETGNTLLGRFGWKAAKASLRQQTAEALLLDMGLTSPVYGELDCQKAKECDSSGASTAISADELELFGQYLGLLAVPAQRDLRSGYPAGIRVSKEHDVNPSLIAQGKQLFNEAKCSGCHTPAFTTGLRHPLAELRNQRIQPYSDLLLHDMGPGLADGLPQGKVGGQYWRTAPLWGLGSLASVQGGPDKVRYLHDGRARSIDEAILWHDGEARTSRELYESMSASDRDALKAFLNSL